MSIILFKHAHFQGKTLLLNESVSTFSPEYGFDEKVSSIRVTSGTWRLYQHSNYSGRYLEVIPGSYNMDIFTNSIGNDVVTSVQLMSS